VGWIHLAQDEHGNVASGCIKCGGVIDRVTISFSRRTLLHGFRYLVS
jgi:hypothetical protein